MLVYPMLLRVAVALIMVEMCWTTSVPSNKTTTIKKPGKYPLQVHQMYKERYIKKQPKVSGVWSTWSEWTPCSRSCGGGIAQQTRRCITKPLPPAVITAKDLFHGKKRRRRQEIKHFNHCVGLYRRIHLCNAQDCPSGQDFRAEQCSSYNSRPLKGKYYYWIPHIVESDECGLNCWAMGASFYATLNKTVEDGTKCDHPLTSTGRMAPKETKGICVDGYCKTVGANGVIGSIEDGPEECIACAQGSCRTISGIYTRPDLPAGYSLVATIPQGACKILVQQLKHTRNYIALKNSNGSYILNGDWKFSGTRIAEGAGTDFTYRKQDSASLETVMAPGPLSSPVDIMIVNHQPNPGIKYEYSIPIDQALEQIAPPLMRKPAQIPDNSIEPRRLDIALNSIGQRDDPKVTHKRQRRRKFEWRVSWTPCSKTCGGGIQTPILSCVREQTRTTVLDRRCSHLEKPTPQAIRCNPDECSSEAQWNGLWGPCSVTCGPGVQRYILQCHQKTSTGRTIIVKDEHCPATKPFAGRRPCSLDPCESTADNEVHPSPEIIRTNYHSWSISPWSQCSASCGSGHRTRQVTCPSGHCRPDDRPAHTEHCEIEPCPLRHSSSSWLLTDWSQCSVTCGMGNQTRMAFCEKDNCDAKEKPEISRSCSSDKQCGGEWFTGPWGKCSDTCHGPAKETRDVICVAKVRGHAIITNDITCPISLKPESERSCDGSCPAMWFTGEWSQCAGNCPNGAQRREVRCMNQYGQIVNTCNMDEMPLIKRTCVCSRRDDMRDKRRPPQDEPANRQCSDSLNNCYLVVQARLCHYAYYTSHCCASCSKASQDSLE